MTRFSLINTRFSSGYFVRNTNAGANTICEYDLNDAIAENDPDLKWDGPRFSSEPTLIAVPPKFDAYVGAYLSYIVHHDNKEEIKNMRNVLTTTIVEYYLHSNKHGIDLYKYIFSQFVLQALYNLPNHFPHTRSFVDTLCYWHGGIEYLDDDKAIPFLDLLFEECIPSWSNPTSQMIVIDDFMSICRVLYNRSALDRLIRSLDKTSKNAK